MSKSKRLLALLLCLHPVLAAADSLLVRGRVVSDASVPLQKLSVRVDGEAAHADRDGNFEFSVDTDVSRPYALAILADDHYGFRHTVHRSDFASGRPATLETIELVQKQPGRTLLMFAGDAMLARRFFEPRDGEPVLVRATHPKEDSQALLQHVKPYVELADYASVNLETQLSAAPLTDRLPKSVTFYSPPELADALQWAGFDYVALGNNHMYDYRQPGLDSTLAVLDRLGLDYSGGGNDDAAARRPAVVSVVGRRHAFLSYVGWPGTFSPSQAAEAGKGGAALGDTPAIAADIGKLAHDTVAVVQLHSGLEYSAQPALTERTTLRQAVRDGADLVLGHHAHVLQGFEIVDDRLIAYSLGNFLFDQYHYTTQLGMLLFVWMDGDRLHRAEVVPLHINGYVPTPATGVFRNAVLHRLAKLSDPASTCLKPSGQHAVIETCASDAQRQATTVRPPPGAGPRLPIALRELGVSPLSAVAVESPGAAYRLGVDILRRGDFDYVGLFGTTDRTWIENDNATITAGSDPGLSVRVPPGAKTARTGQRVFERVFSSSNPATVSGRISVDGAARMRVLLQRRRSSDTLAVALAEGPVTEVGSIELSAGMEEFSFDYAQPRIATASVRLIFEIEDAGGSGVVATLDDLAWVEWRTPWMNRSDTMAPTYATHVQFQE